eukprot:1405776-Rhodomonas_salina.1
MGQGKVKEGEEGNVEEVEAGPMHLRSVPARRTRKRKRKNTPNPWRNRQIKRAWRSCEIKGEDAAKAMVESTGARVARRVWFCGLIPGACAQA